MTQNNSLDLAKQKFFMRKSPPFKLDAIDELHLSDMDYQRAFGAFKDTLNEIIGAAQAFFNLSMASAIDNNLSRLYVVNTLRVRAELIGTDKEDDEAEIQKEAQKRTQSEWSSKDHDDALLEEVARKLNSLYESVPELIASSNNAILRQSTVMLWSAVETLLREYFRITLNHDPAISIQLFASDEGKRYWNMRDLTLDVIVTSDFNLRQKMGDVLLDINPMINIKSIKAAYSVLLPKSEKLLKTLKSQATYNLFSLRNLVAHKSGIVDEKFLAETNFTYPIGTKIEISPSEFGDFFRAAKSIGTELFEYADRSINMPAISDTQ